MKVFQYGIKCPFQIDRAVFKWLSKNQKQSNYSEKPKPKQLLRPITTGAGSAMNQSQFLAITCNSHVLSPKGLNKVQHWLWDLVTWLSFWKYHTKVFPVLWRLQWRVSAFKSDEEANLHCPLSVDDLSFFTVVGTIMTSYLIPSTNIIWLSGIFKFSNGNLIVNNFIIIYHFVRFKLLRPAL